MQAYLDAAASLSHAVEDPLKGLSDAVTGLATAMLKSWQAAARRADAATSVSQTVITNAPTSATTTTPFSNPPQSPSDTWRAKGWKP
jgi:hypothetical protein